jgi:hypothetical protein
MRAFLKKNHPSFKKKKKNAILEIPATQAQAPIG